MSLNIYDKTSKQKILVDGSDEIDSALSLTSANPIENRVITQELQDLSSNDSAIVNVLGAKNLLPNNATTQVVSGVTFTVNSNGSVTLSGTPSSDTGINLVSSFILPKGTYKVTSGQSQELNSEIFVFVRTISPDEPIARSNDVDLPSTFTLENDTAVRAGIYRFATSSSEPIALTIYPTIRPASITDNTYVPYSMTNRELTNSYNKIIKTPVTWYDVTSSAVTFLNTSDFESNKIRVFSNGVDCIIQDEYRLSSNPQSIQGGWIPALDNIRINSAYAPRFDTPLHGFFADNSHSPIFWQLTTSGDIAGFTGSTLTTISRIPIYGRWTIHG